MTRPPYNLSTGFNHKKVSFILMKAFLLLKDDLSLHNPRVTRNFLKRSTEFDSATKHAKIVLCFAQALKSNITPTDNQVP